MLALLCSSASDAYALNPQPLLKGVGKLLKPLEQHLDDLFTLAPVFATLFAKASGVATTLVTAVYARSRRSKRSIFLICLTLGLAGGVWTSQAWFGCPFGSNINLLNLSVTAISAVASLLIWLVIAMSRVDESGNGRNPEHGSGGNG